MGSEHIFFYTLSNPEKVRGITIIKGETCKRKGYAHMPE